MTKKRSSPIAKSPSAVSIPRGFAEVFQELKKKIQEARLSAAVAVNQRLIKLYWEMGKTIFEIQQTQKWGSRDIESLGNELQKEFPGISGFSRSNLFKMRAFYLSYEKVSQTVKQFEELPISQIPWGHNVILVTKIKDTKERLWYAHMTIEEGWSREALEDAIASKFFHRHGKAITNFKDRLPELQSQLAQEVLKDPYQFDFLELRNGYKERELEQGLIDHIQQFLIELGQGFAFVARQYHIEVDGDDYYIDLLFYHLQLRCYCVVEIKTTSFKPEYAGKMNFYLSAVDDFIKSDADNPSIGLILCKTKKQFTAEYALRDIRKPMGVSQYEGITTKSLPKRLQQSLPSIQEIEAELSDSPTNIVKKRLKKKRVKS
jgi:predicted nuclease of restriction endonuclease-like (RecB) superfamily